MPRPLLIRVAIVALAIVAVLVALSFVDASKTPGQVVKILPDNAIAR